MRGVMHLRQRDKGMLKARIKEQNTAAYLTIMSIIQGVALSFFTFVVVNEYQQFTNEVWVLVGSTFLILILTWFEYIMGISIFVWLHGVLDSIIPFSLFVVEIMLIHTMSLMNGEWYFSMCLFCLVALFAFANMYFKASREVDNKGLIDWLGKWKVATLGYLFVSLLLFALLWKYWRIELVAVMAWFSLALIVAFALRAKLYWAKVLRYAEQDA